MDDSWLSKDEVNSLYYDTVGGQIAFATEAAGGTHSTAIARLVASIADALGRRQIRVLEIGANNCGFARKFLLELVAARAAGNSRLQRVDYLAVEYSRAALVAAAEWEEREGVFDRVALGPAAALGSAGPPERPSLVALITAAADVEINLGLVHAEANQFVRANSERFDFVILNELLDDMPWQAYFADGGGRPFEAVVACRADGERWTVRIGAEPLTGSEGVDLPPAMLAARSPASVELVERDRRPARCRAGCSLCTTTASPSPSMPSRPTSRCRPRCRASRSSSSPSGARRVSRAGSSGSSATTRRR